MTAKDQVVPDQPRPEDERLLADAVRRAPLPPLDYDLLVERSRRQGTRTRRRRQAVAGLALAACVGGVVALAGVIGDARPGDEPGIATTSPSPTDPPSSAPVLTPPGARLEVGETATVEVRESGKRAVVAYTVTRVRTGSPADLAGVELNGEDPSAWSIFYLDLRVRLVSGRLFADAPMSEITGRTDSAEMGRIVVGVSGDGPATPFPRCEPDPIPFTAKAGATTRTCLVAYAPGGAPLDTVALSLADITEGQQRGRITWRP